MTSSVVLDRGVRRALADRHGAAIDHDEDRAYRAYCEAIDLPMVTVSRAEYESLLRDVRRGEEATRTAAAERQAEERHFAAEERRAIEETDLLWPEYAAVLGIETDDEDQSASDEDRLYRALMEGR